MEFVGINCSLNFHHFESIKSHPGASQSALNTQKEKWVLTCSNYKLKGQILKAGQLALQVQIKQACLLNHISNLHRNPAMNVFEMLKQPHSVRHLGLTGCDCRLL